MLLGIHVYNYRVLKDVQLGLSRDQVKAFPAGGPLYPLRALTVLVGENRSGKSSLIEALAFLRQTVLYGLLPEKQRVHKLQEFRTFGETDAPAFEIVLLAPKLRAVLFYRLDLAESDGEAIIKSESLERVTLTQDFLEALDWEELIPAEEKSRGTEECFRRTSEGQIFYDHTGGRVMEPETSALAAWELTQSCPEAAFLKEYFEKICFLHMPEAADEHGHISSYEISEEKLPVINRGKLLRSHLEKMREQNYSAYRRMSDGLMRILQLDQGEILHWLGRLTEAEKKLAVIALFLLAKEPCSMLGIENPDYGLFPDKVDSLARELRSYVISNPDAQIVMTTSHMNLLESVAPREVWTFCHKIREDDGHSLKPEEVPMICVRCAASDPLVCAMYDEGVGLGTLLYGGYLA